MKTFLDRILMVTALLVGVAPLPAAVTITRNGDHVDFRAGADLVTRYHIDASLAKPYFWPVHGPHGAALTRAWPMEKAGPGTSTDHPHQKSAWFCHGDVIPEGLDLKEKVKGVQGVDFWSESPGHGRIVCTRVDKPVLAADHGQVVTHNDWRTADGTPVLEETRTIHLYDFGTTRLLVLEVDLEATRVPITFGDTKEGSMGVRVNDRLTAGRGTIENAEGKTGEFACWGRHSAWCDYSGTVDEQPVGIALLDDPGNAAPACWHCRAYGLMAANPFGRAHSGFPAEKGRTDLVKLARGEHLKLRYGLLLHPGDARQGRVADYYDRFVKLSSK